MLSASWTIGACGDGDVYNCFRYNGGSPDDRCQRPSSYQMLSYGKGGRFVAQDARGAVPRICSLVSLWPLARRFDHISSQRDQPWPRRNVDHFQIARTRHGIAACVVIRNDGRKFRARSILVRPFHPRERGATRRYPRNSWGADILRRRIGNCAIGNPLLNWPWGWPSV